MWLVGQVLNSMRHLLVTPPVTLRHLGSTQSEQYLQRNVSDTILQTVTSTQNKAQPTVCVKYESPLGPPLHRHQRRFHERGGVKEVKSYIIGVTSQ